MCIRVYLWDSFIFIYRRLQNLGVFEQSWFGTHGESAVSFLQRWKFLNFFTHVFSVVLKSSRIKIWNGLFLFQQLKLYEDISIGTLVP